MQPKHIFPRAAFPANPKVNSDQELNEALHEIGYLTAVEAEHKAELKRRVEELTDEYQNRLSVGIGSEKKTVPIAEHVNKLNQAIEKYCSKNRGKLLEGDKKSREFSHGTVGWREGKDRIDFCEGYSSSKVEKLVDTTVAGGVLKKIRKLLESLHFVGTRAVSLVCEPKLAFSKTNTLKAYKDGKLKDEHLDAIGVCFVAGDEQFYIKPNDVALQSESA